MAEPIQADTAAIAKVIRAGMRSQGRSKRRAVVLSLIHEVRYAEGEAELILKIPTLPVVNCQRAQRGVGSSILLKVTRRLA